MLQVNGVKYMLLQSMAVHYFTRNVSIIIGIYTQRTFNHNHKITNKIKGTNKKKI